MYLQGLMTLMTNHVVGLLSPGPCTSMVISNSLENRQKGLMTVLGATLGSFSIKTLSVLGLAILLTSSPILFEFLKILGGFYLVYLGGKYCLQAFEYYKNPPSVTVGYSKATAAPFVSGYLMSISNPMSSVRFVAIFSTVVTPDLSLAMQISYLFVLAIISFIFYTTVALFFSTERVQFFTIQYRYILLAILGGSLAYWGIVILMKTIFQ